MKELIIGVIITLAICLVGFFGVRYDVTTATDKIKVEAYKKGYKEGSAQSYSYLREPDILEEHKLNGADPTDFGGFMWDSREKEK